MFGFEEVEGVRRHGIANYLDLVGNGRIDLTPMLTQHVPPRRVARRVSLVLATQDESGAIKVAQSTSAS